MQNRQIDDVFWSQYSMEENYFQEIDLSEVPSHQDSLNKETSSNGGVLFIPMGFILIVWTILAVARLDFWKTFHNRLIPIKHSSKIPCSNCQFFKNDPYLKCAVHPSKVLSEDAIDCPDHWPEDSTKFWQ